LGKTDTMVKTGAGSWALIFSGLTLFGVIYSGFNEATLILSLFTGYFFGVSSPESKMNAAFATHLQGAKMGYSIDKINVTSLKEEE